MQEATRVVDKWFPGVELVSSVRLTGGVSADVFRVDVKRIDGRSESLVLRVHGASHSGHSASLEYQLLQALHQSGVSVPEPLAVDDSGSILKEHYLLMTFVEGSTVIPAGQEDRCIGLMAQELARIHEVSTTDLPLLPPRTDPITEVFEFLPQEAELEALVAYLQTQTEIDYSGSPKLLHGDFWPENLLWKNGRIDAVLDWEDAALGDPLSDVACARVELRYRYGPAGMRRFTEAYAEHNEVDMERLALWQIYVAAAAHRYMGDWGLDPDREVHMRNEAYLSIREAGDALMTGTALER